VVRDTSTDVVGLVAGLPVSVCGVVAVSWPMRGPARMARMMPGAVPVMVTTMVACLVCCHGAAHLGCQVRVDAALNV
jgi:hypothetical protein